MQTNISFIGSLTDSVCTAYEPKSSKLVDKTAMIRGKSEAETTKTDAPAESTFAPVTNLTSRLGGKSCQLFAFDLCSNIFLIFRTTFEYENQIIQRCYDKV